MNPLLQQFLVEGRELIEDATGNLLALERDPAATERIAAVFRAFHTLKGSSGLFDVRPMTRVLHAAEDALAAVRAGRLEIAPALTDLLLDYLDHTARWLADLEATGTLPPDAGTRADGLIGRLGRGTGPRTEEGDGGPRGDGGDEAADFPDADRMAALAAVLEAAPPARLLAVTYAPDPRCFFNGDDPLRLVRALDGLAALRITQPAPWPPPGEMDPFVCALSFRMLVVAGEAGVREVFRFVSDQVRIDAVEPAALVRPQGARLGAPQLRELAATLDGPWEAARRADLRQAVAGPLRDLPPDSAPASALRWLAWLLDRPAAPRRWAERPLAVLREAALSDLAERVRRDVVRAVIAEQQRVLEAGGPGAGGPGRIGSVATVVINALLSEGEGDEARRVRDAHAEALATGTDGPLRRAIESLARRASPPAVAGDTVPGAAEAERATADWTAADWMAAGRTMSGRMLRVDETRIDQLLNLANEMIAANGKLAWLAEEVAASPAGEAAAHRLRDVQTLLDRLTREMHGTVIQLRMLPIGQVFQRFPRLVRDLSRRLGKEVRLVLEGEDVEADKGVVEALFEPLLHLVRNSLDHGVETPEERRAAGKPAEAVLVLRASRDGDRILVDVVDDGRGIDTEAVRRRAAASGLIDAGNAGARDEEDAVRLIFVPGFSTRETASELSGRGIGMYAVRTMIEKAGGQVAVSSTGRAGTTVRLALPLTAAMTRILTVTVGRRRFGVPIDVVRETVRLPRDRIRRIRRHHAVVLRERVVALHRLDRLLGLPPEPGPQSDASASARIMVVEVDGRCDGIEVDGFGGRLDAVLKPLDGLLADVPGYLGTTVLGDGEVLLVLDLREILR
jgi:two-component system chemotaxis sensor kinase CheA